MKRRELVAVITVALTLLIGGSVWLFGAWALVTSGAVLLVPTFFIDVKEDRG